MRAKTIIASVRVGSVILAVAEVVVVLWAGKLNRSSQPQFGLMEFAEVMSGVLSVVAVRAAIFGLPFRKRLRNAWRLSFLLNAIVFVLPTMIQFFTSGISSDVAGTVILVVIVFAAPCAVSSTVVAAVPLFDDRVSGRTEATT